jgi:glycosyltransferase involved in cell wall biosynthesis
MYHANLLGGLAAAISGRTPVVWGIHHSDIIKQHTKVLSFVTSRACAVLSSWLPARIVCCAESAKAVHIEKGYAAAKMTVITNGIDVRTFQPAPELGAKFRQEQGILPTVPLFCHVARFHPQKDHLAFLRAVKLILSKRPDAHFALCGEDVTWENPALTGYIAALGIARDHIRLLGRVEDVRPVLNAAIAVVSSSYGEAFPVTLGEAMACGSVCVVTRVGDCEEIVGQQSGLVPARDPEALAKGCMDVLDMLPEQLHRRKLANRRRIEQRFSLPAMTRQYEVLYRELASESR